jgi:hypothetical protein
MDKSPKLRKMHKRFCTWYVKSQYKAGLLMTVWKEISKRKLDLLRIQEIRWKRVDTERVGKYTFFYLKWNDNHELGSGYFIHKKIITEVKRIKFVSDRILYEILIGQ